ncbi:transposable element P transposase isoform X2 [Rhipicephalus microplus]|uniref:transposable element P transposase isoform X2 n=1 Tax=Rhipicephalus microplus TaxID=6941 RepID=UPI003F6BD69A
MKYNKEWMLECILLRMRSPKLYDYIRRQNILVLPGNTTIRKYISSYMANFGFNENMLQTLKKKTATMDRFKCQGDIVIDEMKLSEHLSVNTAGKVNGFVDLGTYTPEEQKQLPCDHGLVVMFVPLIGSWSQILGTFATRTDIKGELLAKIVLEATILAEKAGLFVNYDTCDAATWNRKMWRMMGVKANSKEVIAKRVHPSDDKRSLYFLSDFPHLVKNIRNRLLQTSFHTPDGKVSMAPLREALKLDENNLTLKAMPRLTKTHLEPNDFEKMRVSLAFQTFGSDSLRGLQLYKPQLEKSCGNIEPTQKFFRYMKPDLVKYYRHSIDWDDMVDHMQNSFQCCGIGPLAYQDWDRNSHYKCAPSNPSHERCSVPESCCRVTSAGCGRNVLSKSWDEAKQLIYGDSCLDSVLSSVRRNVVVGGGVALLLSVGLLLAVATTRDYSNALRRQPKLQTPDDGFYQ